MMITNNRNYLNFNILGGFNAFHDSRLFSIQRAVSNASSTFVQCISQKLSYLKSKLDNKRELIIPIGSIYLFSNCYLKRLIFTATSIALSANAALNSYLEFRQNVKQQGHWLNLEGTVAHPIWKSCPFEGETSDEFFIETKKMLHNFFTHFDQNLQLNDEKRAELIEAFDFAISEKDPINIAARIQEGKLTILEGGWSTHAVAVAFFGNTFAISNRGPAAESFGTLRVFSFEPAKINPSIIRDLINDNNSFEEKSYFLYMRLSELLSSPPFTDPLDELFLKQQPSLQKVGNCSLASKQGILRYAWTMLLNLSPTEETLERACLETKLFNNFTALMVGNASLPPLASNASLEQKKESMEKKRARFERLNAQL